MGLICTDSCKSRVFLFLISSVLGLRLCCFSVFFFFIVHLRPTSSSRAFYDITNAVFFFSSSPSPLLVPDPWVDDALSVVSLRFSCFKATFVCLFVQRRSSSVFLLLNKRLRKINTHKKKEEFFHEKPVFFFPRLLLLLKVETVLCLRGFAVSAICCLVAVRHC